MENNDRYPSVSIVIATFNSKRTIRRCLESIITQKYPKEKVEIIVVDGNSTDDTAQVAKTFGATVVVVPPALQNAEYNKSIGIARARFDLVAMIDHDNILPHTNWLANMVQPLVENRSVVGVETLRYTYDPKESTLDRYFALFGTGDPFVWYLGRVDRLSYMYDKYNLAGRIIQDKPYYMVQFRPERIPTIGANGFLIRRKLLLSHAKSAPGEYFDMDVNVDLIKKGFDTYAFIDDGILHLTGYGNPWQYLKRRMLFMTQYHVKNKNRRYEIYAKKDIWRLFRAIVYCVTIIVPFFESVRGFMKIKDFAWFLHPIMGLGFVGIYSWVIIRQHTIHYANKILGK